MAETRYETLRDSLRDLPMTWYPDLTRALVEAGYAAGTWQEGGCSRFVWAIEAERAERAGEA